MSSELSKRLLVAFIGIPVVLSCILLNELLFLLMIMVLSAVAVKEIQDLKGGAAQRFRVISVLAALLIPMVLHFFGVDSLMTAFLLIVLSSGVASILTDIHRGHQGLLVTLFALSLVIIPFSSLVIIRDQMGAWIIFMIFGGVWISDSAAYFVGKHLGKTKMAPTKSPNKSVEGAIGGITGGVAWLTIGGHWIIPGYSLVDTAVMGIIVGLFSIIGDLLQSIVKRESGVKDSGNVLPGHGGVYDRFDSLMVVSGVLFLYFFARGFIQ